MFKSANCNNTVASNKDDAVELTLYRTSGTHTNSQKPVSDPVAQAELGDASPATREVSFLSEQSRTYVLLYMRFTLARLIFYCLPAYSKIE